MRVCLGGTFHPFHKGHEALLQEAARGADELFVGITTGELAERADRTIPPAEMRAEMVRGFLEDDLGFLGKLVVRPIDDAVGPAATEPYDAIAVSAETVAGAEKINTIRQKAKRKPLKIRVVPHVLADDLLPISSTRVAAEDIDLEGHRVTPVRVAVGSANPVKVAGVTEELARIFGTVALDVDGFAVASGVPEQPKRAEILEGARNRASASLASWPDADYAVGIEAGLQTDDEGAWYDVQCCVVRDRLGDETIGWGPAFAYPEWVTRRALAGEMISEILGPEAGDPRIGGTTGAIGFLTDGRLDRTQLTRSAVLMAFVPRLNRGLYRRSQ